MGIEDETDRTLFIRNLDSRVTEELLFELFIQAGPLIKTKIPKDTDGKQKTFGFAVYKHEVSAPYAMHLLNGMSLFGRTLHVQFRSGSSHSSSPGNSQNSSPANTPNPHGQRTPIQFSSPPYTPPPQMQRSVSSPDNLQKHVMMSSSGRSQRYADEPSSGHHQQHGQSRNNYQNDRSSNRHHDGRGGNRHYDDRGGSSNRGYQDRRWRRY
ncbi:RNA-binding protein 7 [Scomber scombrus]|uniref:RNA-binding protein 7 n=1 Tax=Scomber scombrus TaxID=13677 RepID=A0AAV1PRQ7_SCOSC